MKRSEQSSLCAVCTCLYERNHTWTVSILCVIDLELSAEKTAVMLTCVVCTHTAFIGREAWQRVAAYFGPITSQISGPE